jgi:hypothetical protein
MLPFQGKDYFLVCCLADCASVVGEEHQQRAEFVVQLFQIPTAIPKSEGLLFPEVSIGKFTSFGVQNSLPARQKSYGGGFPAAPDEGFRRRVPCLHLILHSLRHWVFDIRYSILSSCPSAKS